MLATMASLQLEMFLLIAVGFAAARLEILTPAAEKSLSALLVNVVLPCNIVHGFMGVGRPTPEFLGNCAVALALSLVIQLAATYGSRAVFARVRSERRDVASYGMIVSNSSFVGLPVAEALYGSAGVTFTSMFQIPIRITMWSAGLALFCSVDRRQTVRKVLTHPCIIACGVGLALMLAGVELPGALGTTVEALSRCTTPFSMLAIGAILSATRADDVLCADTALFCLVRLVAFPLLVWMATAPLGLDAEVRAVAVLMSAMPAGSTTAILPEQYGRDARYGAGLILSSTLLSMVTLPLMCSLPL